jgi:hypothetical protein
MSLAGGDLTTQARVATWMSTGPTPPSAILGQLIGSMTALIYSKLNRARIYSQSFTRTFDGVGNMQLVLPDYPVTNVTSVQQGNALVPPSVLPNVGTPQPPGTNYGYGWRIPLWAGNLPGENAVLEFVNGSFYVAAQNVKVTYQAGYLISQEPALVPSTPGPYTVTVLQPQGIWSRDNGVVYAASGIALTPVKTLTVAGQYIPPTDNAPGLYTFDAADEGAALLISYSFVPADLEEACIQLVAERYTYRGRVGDMSKSLGGQETMRFRLGIPSEIMCMIDPYVSVVYPQIGAPI